MKSSQNTWNRCGKLCSSPSNCIVISIQFTQSSLRSFAHLSWSLIDNSQFHFSLWHFIFAKCAHFSMEKLMNIAVYLTHACHSIHLFIFFFSTSRTYTQIYHFDSHFVRSRLIDFVYVYVIVSVQRRTNEAFSMCWRCGRLI